jgi:hypothetical protein
MRDDDEVIQNETPLYVTADVLEAARAAKDADLSDALHPVRSHVPISELNEHLPSSMRPRVADTDDERAIRPALVASSGTPLGDDELIELFARSLGDSWQGQRTLGSWRWDYPGDQRVVAGLDLRAIRAKVASGGICAPVSVRYELEEVSGTDRPLRDGLPSFNADRGGIQFNSPPHLVDILADQGSAALTTVTAAQDAASGTKTVQEVACGTLNTVQVRAIAVRLQFSNFADRFNPERLRAFVGLGMSAHARLAERELLEDMRTASTVVSSGTVYIGASRSAAEILLTAAQAMRYRHRMADGVNIVCILPSWVGALFEIDLLLQQPGDNVINNGIDGRRWLEQVLAPAGVRVIWQRDDARTNNSQGGGAPAFTAQSGFGATLQDFPGRVEAIMFPEGSFLILDGGVLDFGVVRDATLNSQNRFQTFHESFEGVAFVGVESLNITMPLCADGSSVASKASTKCGGVGS